MVCFSADLKSLDASCLRIRSCTYVRDGGIISVLIKTKIKINEQKNKLSKEPKEVVGKQGQNKNKKKKTHTERKGKKVRPTTITLTSYLVATLLLSF